MNDSREPTIEIAENGLSATLRLPAYFDRATLNPSLFNSLLTQAGIELESMTKAMADDYIAKAQDAPPGVFEAVLAEGTAAVHGQDARIEWTSQAPQEQNADNDTDPDVDAADTDGDGDEPVSFYNRSVYNVVEAGAVLGQVYPEVPGQEGKDVRGKVIAARTAKPLDFKYDESIALNAQHQLIAKTSGVLIINGKTAAISDTIEVENNVDFNTGNIDFDGNILVHRGVKDCFVVKATEDVEVRGLIEAATIIAGRDLRALGGFAGREQGTAEVHGDLHAKYLDAVETDVRGDLCVDREIINCTNRVLGSIVCPRGAIIGGETRVSGTVEVLDLGAGAQPNTIVHIGLMPELDPLLDALSALTDGLIIDRQKLLDEKDAVTARSASTTAALLQAELNPITFKIAEVQQHLDRAEPALEALRKKADERRVVDVQINRKLHPNAVLVCNGFRYRVMNEIRGPVRITLNKRGQLEYQRGESKPELLSAECELRGAA
ncbi:MAG: DUF342 domain-containing protein [Phycisphaeraceae bacterium]